MLGLQHPENPPSSGTSVTLVQDKPRVPLRGVPRPPLGHTKKPLQAPPTWDTPNSHSPPIWDTPRSPCEGSQRPLLFRIPQNCPHSRAPRAPPGSSCRAPQGPSGHRTAQPPSPQDRDSSTNGKQLPLHWCCSNTSGCPYKCHCLGPHCPGVPLRADACLPLPPAARVSPQPWVLLSAHPCCPYSHSGQVSPAGPE